MRYSALVLSAMITAPMAHAGPFDGTYALTEGADCSRVGEDGGALRIAEGVFTGVESECRMTRPVNVVDMDAKIYTMQCSGEGSVWTERAIFMRAADGGLIAIWDGYAFKYDSCEAGTPDDTGN